MLYSHSAAGANCAGAAARRIMWSSKRPLGVPVTAGEGGWLAPINDTVRKASLRPKQDQNPRCQLGRHSAAGRMHEVSNHVISSSKTV